MMGDLSLFASQAFNGFSLASLYILAALGLALSFGLMRVINMAHGEMLMLGGYFGYLTLQLVSGPLAFFVALAAAFIGAAIVGAGLQTTLVRRLADRPLDTLLVTWGVSLILQQGARNIFGPVGVEVSAPAWLDFRIEPFAALSMSGTRLFILLMAILVLGALALFLARSRIGLTVRAVNQDRSMAEALGINAGLVDLVVFSLGTGIAGMAGVILALLGPVTPTVGQSYIVPAFMVVIMGGIGSIAGATMAGLAVGLFSALCQLFVDVSMAQVLLLLFVIAFIQVRPRGMVAPASRALDG